MARRPANEPQQKAPPNPVRAFIFFAWILVMQLVGLAVFTKGFFLTRVELARQSQCDIHSLLSMDEAGHLSDTATQQQHQHRREATPTTQQQGSFDEDGCWLPPRFKRVVWIVVDALRYDFAAYSPPPESGGEPSGGGDAAGGGDGGHQSRNRHPHSAGARHYLNHLPVINEAIGGFVDSSKKKSSSPSSPPFSFEGSGGMLFQFEADPPTVTMQRLKGLTTGGLPTFIDFRDNFHSPEIAEDNWVAQVKTRAAARRQHDPKRRQQQQSYESDSQRVIDGAVDGKGVALEEAVERGKLVFMGDDTWTSLYPTYFSRSYPFPSFNTRDLHTVDKGVLSNLSNELAKDDWEVLVAHFLGVDHVGHTFGPASQAMEDKLDEIDAALRTVFSSVDKDTVVFVLGDHGMTEDGNHGGATPEETGAALLVWSPSSEQLLGRQRRPLRDDPNSSSEPASELPPAKSDAEAESKSSESKSSESKSVLAATAGIPDHREGNNNNGYSGKLANDHHSVVGLDGSGDSNRRRRAGFTLEGGGGDEEFNTDNGVESSSSGRRVAQIDLVPTVSLLLGTPIPFGNLGSVIPELFAGPYYGEGEGSAGEGGKELKDDSPRYHERLCDALLVNSIQVWKYLSDYAEIASMPQKDMLELEKLLTNAREEHLQYFDRCTGRVPRVDEALLAENLRQVCALYRKFLDASIGLGRSLWTQYDTTLMWWGLAVLLMATLVLAIRSAFEFQEARRTGGGGAKGTSAEVMVGVGWLPAWSRSTKSDGGVGYSGLWGAGIGVAGVLFSYPVFGPSGRHAFAAKVAICSCLGVFLHYLQIIWAHHQHCLHYVSLAPAESSKGSYCEIEPASPGLTRARMRAGRGGAGAVVTAPVIATAVAVALSTFYCAGLFSNSFIEAEDGLHRFLGASALLLLAGLFILLAPPTPCLPNFPSSSLLSSSPLSSPPVDGKISAASTAVAAAVTVAAPTPSFSGRSSRQQQRGVFPFQVPFLFSSETSTAAGLYTAIAAACLRAAAAFQESASEAGVSTEATFGIVRSLLPLPALWYLCGLGCGGYSISGGQGTSMSSVFTTRGGAGEKVSGGSVVPRSASRLRAVFLFHRVLQALSFVAAAAYWANEGGGISEGHGADGPMLGVFPPIRLLLPRLTYLFCLVGLIMAVLRPPVQLEPSGNGSPISQKNYNSKPTEVGHPGFSGGEFPQENMQGYSKAVANTSALVISHLLPVVVLLLGPGSPAVVLLMSVACGFVLKGVSLAAGGGVAVPLGAVAVTWSVVGRAFFFLTDHHNQFSRLQYSAAFVGFDEFDFKVGGLLLFLNTFGTEILAALTLPLLAAAATATTSSAAATKAATVTTQGISGRSQHSNNNQEREYFPREQETSGFSGGCKTPLSESESVTSLLGSGLLTPSDYSRYGNDPAKEGAKTGRDDQSFGKKIDTEQARGLNFSPPLLPTISSRATATATAMTTAAATSAGCGAFLSVMGRLSGLVLLLSSARTFLSAANVSLQRGHLMLWAVFAPKFVFDATMQAVCGTAAVTVWAVVLAAHRSFFATTAQRRLAFNSGRGTGRRTGSAADLMRQGDSGGLGGDDDGGGGGGDGMTEGIFCGDTGRTADHGGERWESNPSQQLRRRELRVV